MLPTWVTPEIVILLMGQLLIAGGIYGGFRVGIASLCRRVTRVEDRQDEFAARELNRAEEQARLKMSSKGWP